MDLEFDLREMEQGIPSGEMPRRALWYREVLWHREGDSWMERWDSGGSPGS